MFRNVNWGGVIVAVIVAELIGFLWYGMLFDEQFMALTGITEERAAGQEWRMGLGVANLIVVMLGLGALLPRLGANSYAEGGKWGLFVAVFFACTVTSLGYIYELAAPMLTALGFGYQILTLTVGGAIIGGLRIGKQA